MGQQIPSGSLRSLNDITPPRHCTAPLSPKMPGKQGILSAPGLLSCWDTAGYVAPIPNIPKNRSHPAPSIPRLTLRQNLGILVSPPPNSHTRVPPNIPKIHHSKAPDSPFLVQTHPRFKTKALPNHEVTLKPHSKGEQLQPASQKTESKTLQGPGRAQSHSYVINKSK